jgi:hypothetical protein
MWEPGVSEWTISGTTTDGVRVEVRGCDIWTFGDDGKIVRKDSFWKIREAWYLRRAGQSPQARSIRWRTVFRFVQDRTHRTTMNQLSNARFPDGYRMEPIERPVGS